MKRYLIHKGGRRKTIWRIIGIATIVVFIGFVIGIRQTYHHNLRPVSASQRSILITIPSGATDRQIANELEKQGVIRAAWAFEWFVRNNDARNPLKAGTYNLRPSQSVNEIVNILRQGKVDTDLVTILPGQRLDQVRGTLVNNAGFSEEEVDKALNPELYADEPALADKPVHVNLEGYLYPESFQKTGSTTAEDIIRASLKEMAKHLTPQVREGFVKQGLTVHQGVILASIVQQEVGNPEDMRTVAQVFLLRLKKDIALESDPTSVYGALKDGINLPESGVEAVRAAINHDSEYNTYKHPGLPPGPISNVNKQVLEAVANPSNTDYLFFVAGDDGVTYFSRTIEEHEKLIDQHCKKACGR